MKEVINEHALKKPCVKNRCFEGKLASQPFRSYKLETVSLRHGFGLSSWDKDCMQEPLTFRLRFRVRVLGMLNPYGFLKTHTGSCPNRVLAVPIPPLSFILAHT